MTRRSSRSLLLGVLLTAEGLLATIGLPAADAGGEVEFVLLDDQGWWFRDSGSDGEGGGLPGGIGVPADNEKPLVQPGELVVQAIDGAATAISALRFSVPRGAKAETLRLGVERVSGNGSLVACIVGSGWSGAEGGDWSAKPLTDCEAGTARVPAPANDQIEVDVSGLQVGERLDVVLVPVDGSDLEVVFDQPTRFDLTVTPPPRASDSATAGTGPAGTPPGSPDREPTVAPPLALDPADSGRSGTSPIERGATEPTIAAPLPTTAEGSRVAEAGSGSTRDSETGSETLQRIVAALVAIAAVAFVLRGGTASPVAGAPRGLGAFDAERKGRPAALR